MRIHNTDPSGPNVEPLTRFCPVENSHVTPGKADLGWAGTNRAAGLLYRELW